MLLPAEELKLTAIVGGLVLVFFSVVIVVTVVQYKQRALRHKIEKETLSIQFADALLRSQLEIREQTLQQIAVELHDNLGQVASLIKINLNALALSLGPADSVRLESTLDLTRQLIKDVKSLSVKLSSDRIRDFGLIECIREDMDRLNSSGQIEARIILPGETPVLSVDTATIVYRMFQEITNNALKHSNASSFELTVSSGLGVFKLACQDNGIGFNALEKVGQGAGLRNLKRRAELIGASLTFDSQVNKGTLVTISLPLN